MQERNHRRTGEKARGRGNETHIATPLEVAAVARETGGQGRGGQGPGEAPNMCVAELRVSA
eukprot:scaffold20825_cov64-Phaeocystis_antarctica.AAC.12